MGLKPSAWEMGYFPSEGNGLILGLDELIPSFDTDAVHEGSISNIDLAGS